MLTPFALAVAMMLPSAPAPKDIAITGSAPRVMELKPDENGKIKLTIMRQEKRKIGAGAAILPAPGGNPAPAPAPVEREITVNVQASVELSEIKDLSVTTAGGKNVDIREALKQIEKGAVVVISTDGKPVDSGFLKIFKDDTLVLTSPEFANLPNTVVRPPLGRPGIRPLPAVLPPAGGIQVLPIQGGVEILPAAPAEKPVEEKK